MATIAVMGAGIGGISQAYELRRELGKEHRIVLIGDSDRFEFTPSNPWVAVGWRKENDIVVDLPKVMQDRLLRRWRENHPCREEPPGTE